MNRGQFFVDAGPGPIIKWTETADSPGNTALLDYVDAALEGLIDYTHGNFSSAEAYHTYKRRIRQEFLDRMMRIAGGK